MGKWIKGDLHVHTQNCSDGTLPVAEIIRRSRKYLDFIGISGHSYDTPDCLEGQYREVEAARKEFPDLPIFHTAEQNFPLQRHTMFITAPDHDEFMLQRALIRNFHRQSGHEGMEWALKELEYVKEHWGEERVFMIYNHPNDPDVPYEDFEQIAAVNDVFKVIACVDRRERRAKQTWEIGEEWDRLLQKGFKLYARNGSDFHKHFEDGGEDYLPGEFVQDYLWVEDVTYDEIIKAYRSGRFYCTVGNCIEEPIFTCAADPEIAGNYIISLSFKANHEMERVEIISDGKCVCGISEPAKDFTFRKSLPGKGYFRVRGWAKPVNRKYSEGQYCPQFVLNPIFIEEE